MPPPGVCQNIMKAHQKQSSYGTINNPERFLQQDHQQLKQYCLIRGVRFIDEMFPPDSRSIGQGILNPSDLARVEWLRPACKGHDQSNTRTAAGSAAADEAAKKAAGYSPHLLMVSTEIEQMEQDHLDRIIQHQKGVSPEELTMRKTRGAVCNDGLWRGPNGCPLTSPQVSPHTSSKLEGGSQARPPGSQDGQVIKRKWSEPRFTGPHQVAKKTSHAVRLKGKGDTWFHWSQCAPAEEPGRSGGGTQEELRAQPAESADSGNCWFLASIGALTFRKHIFRQVVPLEQHFSREYCGLFHFRFWRFGRWVDVVVDDKLPTINGRLIFVHSKDQNEFWPALLEKAYAKVCGSYMDMTSGTPAEAMRDFTGGVHVHVPLSPSPSNLWALLCRAGQSDTHQLRDAAGGKETPANDVLPNGLVRGHAYTVTGFKQLMSRGEAVNLVRLWNPWGKGEWNGAWSDRSPLWQTVNSVDRMTCLSVTDDGEFWMTLEHFCEFYNYAEICGLSPDFLDENSSSTWKTSVHEGRWVAGTTAGGCMNNRGGVSEGSRRALCGFRSQSEAAEEHREDDLVERTRMLRNSVPRPWVEYFVQNNTCIIPGKKIVGRGSVRLLAADVRRSQTTRVDNEQQGRILDLNKWGLVRDIGVYQVKTDRLEHPRGFASARKGGACKGHDQSNTRTAAGSAAADEAAKKAAGYSPHLLMVSTEIEQMEQDHLDRIIQHQKGVSPEELTMRKTRGAICNDGLWRGPNGCPLTSPQVSPHTSSKLEGSSQARPPGSQDGQVIKRKWSEPRFTGPHQVAKKTSHAVRLKGKGDTWFHWSQCAPAEEPGRSGGGTQEELRAQPAESADSVIKSARVSRFDFGQGSVGNCWFLASIGALTFRKHIFRQVVPLEQHFSREYCGLFHFRFWRFGRWVDVVVDDKLPTINGRLIFVHSKDQNEFWPALLEKAYAKVCGSYMDMTSGTPAEAMRDFTGGVHVHVPLSPSPSNLWALLCRAGQSELTSCGTQQGETPANDVLPNGLVRGHAYTVTGFKQLMSRGEAVNLVRLWNPWGKGEWNGAWSDRSPLWQTVNSVDRMTCLSVTDDGEFWMTLEHFCEFYNYAEICGLSPDFLDENSSSTWKTSVHEGRWVAGTTAGGCMNNRGGVSEGSRRALCGFRSQSEAAEEHREDDLVERTRMLRNSVPRPWVEYFVQNNTCIVPGKKIVGRGSVHLLMADVRRSQTVKNHLDTARSQTLNAAAMPLHGVCQNIMNARQKEDGYGTLKNPERFEQQNYQQLKDYHLIRNMRFGDETFPPDNRSIGQGKLDPAVLAQVEWRRPWNIVTNPCFVLDGVSRFDFGQGQVGNCWFLASIGALTFHKEIFQMVVPLEQTCMGKDYCGLFHFRFWRFGKWVDVVIDDKLPTIKGKPIFARSKDPCEFWPALLEKAYAKVCGSYADMSSGTPAEAMRDFTGGIYICIELSEPSSNLWKLLCRAGTSQTFMSCSTIPKEETTTGDTFPNGLVPGHAYTVTGLKELVSHGKVVKLVRLWNPWGHGEWTGDWSDLSPLWQNVSTKDREECLKVENDGEFWMDLEDCCKYYTRIDICSLRPDFLDETPACHWKTSMYENRWVAGTTAGGYINYKETFWTNPQYRIKVYGKPNSSQTKNTLVSLMQKPDKRNRRLVQNLFIGFIIFADEKHAGKFTASFFSSHRPVAQTEKFIKSREVMMFLALKPGEYLIVPCTLKPNETASFLLTILSQEETHCYENSGQSCSDPVEKVKKEKNGQDVENKKLLFRQYSDKYEDVDAELLQRLLNELFLEGDLKSGGFGIDACRSMVALMDTSVTGKLNSQEFVHLWNKVMKYKEVFAKMDVSRTGTLSLKELRNALRASGMSVNDELLNLMAVRYGASSGQMSLENFISLTLRLSCMNKIFEKLSDGRNVKLSKTEWLSLSMYT
ncbi:LOW QUALITY PROTEIN: uncharacterized protein FYW61_014681 [Anableps anableps]